MWRTLILVGLLGCINQAARAVSPPPPEGGGTLTCREIVETCDSACTQPFCLHGCTNQGTDEARPQHDALLSCGQTNGCTDEECMRANCMAEWEGCQGPPGSAEPPPSEEVPAEGPPGEDTPPEGGPPGETPPAE